VRILGISCFYHDSAVAAVQDNAILFAIHEERLSRVKHDSRFPIMAVEKALEVCGWRIDDVDEIVFYENPQAKLERIFDQVIDDWPHSKDLFFQHLPRFVSSKFPFEKIVRETLAYRGHVRFSQHHRSHAAAAFYTSPFDKSLVVTVDGVGESETTAVFWGDGNSLKKIQAVHFPDSLGLLYSVFTDYLGFQVNEGEYKVMGLAPYGKPHYQDKIQGKLLHLNPDGSFWLDQKYFCFSVTQRHYSPELVKLLGVPPRTSREQVTSAHADLAASIQRCLEMALENMLQPLLKKFPTKNVCLGGGVALNCTANAHLIRACGINLHIHPAAGDAGGALGAALDQAVRSTKSQPCRYPFQPYLGLESSDALIEHTLHTHNVPYQKLPNIAVFTAAALAQGNILAVVHGRDEWGPRALGNRSILADPRSAAMKDHLNAKIKFREEFRPFAPVVMLEHYAPFFETLGMTESPHMLFTHKVLQPEAVPAVVHVDQTSRVQTVSSHQNPFLYAVLEEFRRLTGVPVLINTSFNLRGEPIVSSPADALKTFFASGIDILVLGDYVVTKEQVISSVPLNPV